MRNPQFSVAQICTSGGVPGASGRTPRDIARLAVRAVMHEAAVTPKPGLVCPDSQGAHRDMDITTMLASALSIEPYFEVAAQLGMDGATLPPDQVFGKLRQHGVAAERAMLAATGGVNTHKGLIFSLGILAAATGRNAACGLAGDCASVCRTGALLVEGIVAHDFAPLLSLRDRDMAGEILLHEARHTLGRSLTAGERLFLLRGATGIRGEAEQGFPGVLAAKAAFDTWRIDLGFNEAAVNTLLLLMRDTEDTNVLHRGGGEGLRIVQSGAAEALLAGGAGTLVGRDRISRLQRQLVERDISPGGCADLLAVTLYFHFLDVCGTA